MEITEDKTTVYPSLAIDEGMFHLINRGYNTHLYLRGEEKSFHIEEIQAINSGNQEILDIILELRTKVVRDKIFKRMKNRSVYILYGVEYKKSRKNYFRNEEIITTKKVICLYIPDCKFCPGIASVKTKVDLLVDPQQN